MAALVFLRALRVQHVGLRQALMTWDVACLTRQGGEGLKKLEGRLHNVHSSGGGMGQLKELEKQVQSATQ